MTPVRQKVRWRKCQPGLVFAGVLCLSLVGCKIERRKYVLMSLLVIQRSAFFSKAFELCPEGVSAASIAHLRSSCCCSAPTASGKSCFPRPIQCRFCFFPAQCSPLRGRYRPPCLQPCLVVSRISATIRANSCCVSVFGITVREEFTLAMWRYVPGGVISRFRCTSGGVLSTCRYFPHGSVFDSRRRPNY